jgi:hypothetical protein
MANDGSWLPIPAVQAMTLTRGRPTAPCDPKRTNHRHPKTPDFGFGDPNTAGGPNPSLSVNYLPNFDLDQSKPFRAMA